ncbi:hypothetical protein PC9H_008870 [Pleurotus ostreatus]|uniref:Mug135-like C-terminal domain-containing protein n=2 Tax=Pleurotus ostreatus TaxID=5322 RepID=A0A067NWC3_PLEO1|nr:uncharacterized protein PC9H_008870 [Pleurotus ostreatus]KAF7426501.1 hypothetical protein PC9H_008870 [Pleurotus ostreatus]KAJ8694054.1 hypothetical protein PTI98_008987 [Pleurotus ostreatus]KDQ32229.1 hypothetical protein PLEOSDRAFT_1100731 [Pleurotus ostreatus PC15]
MAAFEWPPDDELKGLFRPPPISNPPTIRDLSNVFHLKRDLFQVSDTYSNETVGKLVLLEHNLCRASLNEAPEPEPEPHGLQAILQQMQESQTMLLAAIDAARAEAATAAQANAAAIAALDARVAGIDARVAAIDTRVAAIDARVVGIDNKLDRLSTEMRQNHGAVAKILNSMQSAGLRTPLLTVPFANNQLPPQNLDVLRDRFTVLHLSAHQRRRYYHAYCPDGAIADDNEDGQTHAILQALGCKSTDNELGN